MLCGLAGGKGIPESVAEHPCTFATFAMFTAPSFGPVHGVRQNGPLRGPPRQAGLRARSAVVVWQWHAPELWRRFTITLQRDLARMCGLSRSLAATTVAEEKVSSREGC